MIGNELTFHKNEATTLMDLFATRYKMFSQVYCHHVGWAIEAMIGDVFTAANDHMQVRIGVRTLWWLTGDLFLGGRFSQTATTLHSTRCSMTASSTRLSDPILLS